MIYKIKTCSLYLLLLFVFVSTEIIGQDRFPVKEVNQQIESLYKAGKFSGAVLHVKNRMILFDKAYGFANHKKRIKNETHYKFNLGSINKLFTKIAITKLLMEKKLSLNDLAKKYIPELSKKGTDKITIYHLLTMSSGYGDYLTDIEFVSNRKAYTKMPDYLPLILKKDLLFEPGEGRRYSNVGFELLGIIVERVSKIDYYEYIQKNILNVASMKNTGYYTKDDKTKNLSTGYHFNDQGEMTPNWELKSYKGTAAGGGYSTTYDMLSLATALMKYQILDKKHLDLLCKNFNENSNRTKYLTIGGGGPGINARFFMHRIKKEVTVVLSNQDPPAANQVNEIFKNLSNK